MAEALGLVQGRLVLHPAGELPQRVLLQLLQLLLPHPHLHDSPLRILVEALVGLLLPLLLRRWCRKLDLMHQLLHGLRPSELLHLGEEHADLLLRLIELMLQLVVLVLKLVILLLPLCSLLLLAMVHHRRLLLGLLGLGGIERLLHVGQLLLQRLDLRLELRLLLLELLRELVDRLLQIGLSETLFLLLLLLDLLDNYLLLLGLVVLLGKSLLQSSVGCPELLLDLEMLLELPFQLLVGISAGDYLRHHRSVLFQLCDFVHHLLQLLLHFLLLLLQRLQLLSELGHQGDLLV
mmetsp:Transcript_118072/g.252252  ORF Transcript_118072/g.252252 Transcript_118072/m.252252 type:complete len:292 (+) Transcript_118072:1360-2235(+)